MLISLTKLKQMIRQNTPTRIAGLKLGRTEEAIRAEASKLNLSLKPTNQSPYFLAGFQNAFTRPQRLRRSEVGRVGQRVPRWRDERARK